LSNETPPRPKYFYFGFFLFGGFMQLESEKLVKITWRDIPNYEGYYQVSNYGDVRSLDRTVPQHNHNAHTKTLKGKIIKQHNCGTNHYLTVTISKDSVHKLFTVHSLVALAFIGEPPSGKEILHGVGGKLDNRLCNLSYGTRSENAFDRLRDGTQTNRPVMRSDGTEFSSIEEAARLTGVCRSTVSAACNNYVNPATGKRRLTAGGFKWKFI
jgi:hypothetical protein